MVRTALTLKNQDDDWKGKKGVANSVCSIKI